MKKVEFEFNSVEDVFPVLDRANHWEKYLCRLISRTYGIVDCDIESYDIVKFSNENIPNGEFLLNNKAWTITHWSKFPKFE